MSIEEKRIAADILVAMVNNNLLTGNRLPLDKTEAATELFKCLYKIVSNPDLPYKDVAPPWCR